MDLSERTEYNLSDEKVLLAIDCIIKDVDKKFDECMVERFLDYISSKLSSETKSWTQEANPIIERLKFYMTHRAFVMLNQARAFKVLHSILKPKKLSENELTDVIPLLDCMWGSFGSMIANNFMSAITVIFSIFDHLLETRIGFQWLIGKKIEPHVDMSPKYDRIINDISSVVRYYIETSNNYHTKLKAEKLFLALITNSTDQTPHTQIDSLKQAIHDLTLQNSPSMISILIELLKKAADCDDPYPRGFAFDQFEIPATIRKAFSVKIEQPNSDVRSLCRCLAMTNTSRTFGSAFQRLKSSNNLEGIVIYLANSRFKSSELSQMLLIYLLYPLMHQCPGDDTEVLIKGLMATREERDFIEKNQSKRIVTSCLVQLGHIIQDTKKANHLSPRSLCLIMRTLANYVKYQYANSSAFKDIMECCTNMGFLIKSCDRLIDMNIVSNPISDSECLILDILDEIQVGYTEQMKPVVLRLLELSDFSFQSIFKGRRDAKKKNIQRYIDLAFKFDDDDILNEFAHIFENISLVPPEDYEIYIKLVWEHMYPKAKTTTHQELLGRLARLLIEIDLLADASSLNKFNIRRYHNVPTILGDILKEYSSVIPTVELLVNGIMFTSLPMLTDPSGACGYLNKLESPTLSRSVKKGLDHLIRGLCITVRGESGSRELSLKFIELATKEIITNSDEEGYILKRLARNGTLSLLYEILTSSLYDHNLYKSAQAIFKFVQSSVVKKLDKPESSIAKQLLSYKNSPRQRSHEDQAALAQTIGIFYTQKLKSRTPQDWKKQYGNTMALHTMVDDILNYDLKSDGITDCY